MKYVAYATKSSQPDLDELKKVFGERPGGYRVDPYYFRTGIGNKAYYWDEYSKKWRLLKFGDEFEFDHDGIMVKTND